GVIRERPGRFAGLPSAEPVLERLRQIPMIQRHKRFDAVGQKFVQKAIVEVEAFGVRGAGSFRKHPRPRDRKTIGFDAQLLDQADVKAYRSEEHTSELQSLRHLVCRLLLEKKKRKREQRVDIS